jgi:hypothetical protein
MAWLQWARRLAGVTFSHESERPGGLLTVTRTAPLALSGQL